jgi:hypothetical protein
MMTVLGNENTQATGSPASQVATFKYTAGEDVKQSLETRKALGDEELFSIIKSPLGA